MLKLFNAYRQLPFYFKIIIALSLMLFVMSLTQPAFYIDRKEDPNAYSDSLVLFLLGWMSLLGGAIVPFILWLANPLYIVSILLILRKKIGALCTTWSSTILALIFWQLKSIMTSESGGLFTYHRSWTGILSLACFICCISSWRITLSVLNQSE